ncbi:hypothetical protein NE237_017023 [Protea cynaroides]|uniref:Lipin N-terminal domain-containing protein n=1 Tax=Protea cynaroides TaxID=273540 RepID=A0A9Q0QMM4_9MAGN|nr:hypothetical protein NE237_017023 [Protea cynaroides]
MLALGGYIRRGVFTVFEPFHLFGGAVDIIVVQQPDGSLKSSPWYVQFGKFQGVLKTEEKVVSITVNGVDAEFHMYLDHKGEAYFLRELDGEQVDSVYSPPSSVDETEEQSQSGRIGKPKSGDFDANQPSSAAPTGEASAKTLAKTSSRSTIFNTETVHENELTSVFSVSESPLPLNLHVTTFNSVESEMLEVNQQDTVTERLAQNDNLEPESVEILENESQKRIFLFLIYLSIMRWVLESHQRC